MHLIRQNLDEGKFILNYKHQVVVNAYSEEWLLKDFDRVYHKEIVAVGSPLKNGTWVEILSMKQSSFGMCIVSQKDNKVKPSRVK